MRRKGFTLVELMIVVAILGIITSIAVPVYRGYLRGAKRQEAKSNLQTIRLLQEQYFADNRAYLAAADTNALKAALPGFEPGNTAALLYDYKVEAGSTGSIATSFLSTATPTANAPAGNLTINEANEKTGW